jgi:UDP-glucuronate 4-epimerase
LLDFIGAIEKALGMKAEKRLLPLQDGDVPATYANTDLLNDWVGFVPGTPIQEGVSRFIAWYRDYTRFKDSLCAASSRQQPATTLFPFLSRA